MPRLSLKIGMAMIVLGLLTYALSGGAHLTALIPSFFGILIAALGWIALKNPAASRHAMHGAMLLSLLAVLGSARVFGALGEGLNLAVISQLVMLGLGLAVLIPGIQSFIRARQKGSA
jgi:hypothetical protein